MSEISNLLYTLPEVFNLLGLVCELAPGLSGICVIPASRIYLFCTQCRYLSVGISIIMINNGHRKANEKDT